MSAATASGPGPDVAPAIVLGGAGAALSITRSLGREGIPVYMLGNAGRSLAGASKYCTEFVDFGERDGQIDAWLEWLRGAPAGSVVLPCGDAGIELVAGHSDELREWGLHPLQNAGEDSLAMLDKEATYAIAREADVPAPRTWRVATLEDLDAVAGELVYPCALKPLHSHRFAEHFSVKLFVAEDVGELREALEKTREHDLQMTITEIIPGSDDQVWGFCTFIDEQGEPLFELTKRKLRSYPIHFGVGSYHMTSWDPAVAEMGMRFLRGAKLRGMANVEFKRDERDGSLKLIECNHRFMASNETLRRAGVNVPLVAYRMARGEPVTVGPWRSGVRLWFPSLDIRSASEMRAEGDLTWPRWVASLVRWPLYMTVLSFDDLRPSFVNTARRARNRSKALLGRG